MQLLTHNHMTIFHEANLKFAKINIPSAYDAPKLAESTDLSTRIYSFHMPTKYY